MALCPGLPRWAGTRKVKPIWILLKQETVSGSVISWAIRKSAPSSRQITTPAPHCSVFTGRMPFLPPNQRRQSTEGTTLVAPKWTKITFFTVLAFLHCCLNVFTRLTFHILLAIVSEAVTLQHDRNVFIIIANVVITIFKQTPNTKCIYKTFYHKTTNAVRHKSNKLYVIISLCLI